jgi:hypothetical protein
MKSSRLLTLSLFSLAMAFAAPQPKVAFHFEPDGFKGDSTRLVVHVSLPDGWHIQSNAPSDSFLIPTTVHAEGRGLVFGPPVFPKPVEKNFPALGGKVALFQGDFDIEVPVKRNGPKIKTVALKAVKVRLGYQACDNTQCLPPRVIDALPDRNRAHP